ncbi:glycosyltransferase family 39 protein [Bifidobacterium sp. ESL0784]|uniref:ArnT family glycosyltransferase n=1 Tax=Bifidobacterium sp. ESL0784 TaxID=2983231 RepID=UPI0023F7340C|nr:glycosyltransferase family 39 protein [Bifidobacterium sp. ESL0784]MDF7640283.1 glycosyltransferase family 39 protein [Bifidobacterium sp. ESL0784]
MNDMPNQPGNLGLNGAERDPGFSSATSNYGNPNDSANSADSSNSSKTTDTAQTDSGQRPSFGRIRSVFTGIPGGRFVSADPVRTVRHSIAQKRTWVDWLAFGIMMVTTAAIMFVNLTANGFANEFYAAAAQAGSKNWEAFLWGSSDAANSITVDKPPAALWLMALSIRAFGLNSFALLLPEALCGVLSVWLLYASVRRYWGNWAGIIAGSTLALTPVAALMFRFDNPDALLVLLMIAASASVLRALEYDPDRKGNRKRTLWLALGGVCIGLGFLTKQMQVFLVLPGFALAILIASPTKFWRRLVDSLVALASMVVSAGWWVLLTVIVPAASRPYIGGSQNNSFLELTFGYNGFGRLTGNETGSVVPGGGGGHATGHAGTGASGGKISETLGNAYSAMTGMGGGPGGAPGAGGGQSHGGHSQGGGMWGQTGITRLFDGVYGTQISWLAPIAFAGILIGLAVSIRVRRTDMRRAGVMVWGGWLVVTWLTFSFMGGIFHQYYTVALAPAVAVMVAVAVQSLWERRGALWSRLLATVLVLVNTLWAAQLLSRSTWLPWLRPTVLVLGGLATLTLLISAIALLPIRSLHSLRSGNGGKVVSKIGLIGIALAMLALYAGPTAWTGYTVATGHYGSIVTAGPEVSGSMGGPGGGQGGPGGGMPGGGQQGQGQGGFGGAMPSQNGQNNQGSTNSGNGANGANNANGPTAPGNRGSNQFGGQSMNNSNGSVRSNNSNGSTTGGVPGTNSQAGKNSGSMQSVQGSQNGQNGFTASGKSGRNQLGGNQGGARGGHGGAGGLLGGDGASSVGTKLKKLLMKDADQYTWIAAATGSQSASGYQLATQKPVMPIGGFNGSDPSPTLAQFKRYVKEGKIHYYIGGGEMGGGIGGNQMGGSNASGQIATWVKANFKSQTVDGVTIYDLTAAKTAK